MSSNVVSFWTPCRHNFSCVCDVSRHVADTTQNVTVWATKSTRRHPTCGAKSLKLYPSLGQLPLLTRGYRAQSSVTLRARYWVVGVRILLLSSPLSPRQFDSFIDRSSKISTGRWRLKSPSRMSVASHRRLTLSWRPWQSSTRRLWVIIVCYFRQRDPSTSLTCCESSLRSCRAFALNWDTSSLQATITTSRTHVY